MADAAKRPSGCKPPAGAEAAQRGDRRPDEEEQADDIALQPLGAFFRQAVLPPAVLLGYTALTQAQVRYAGQKLARLLARARAEPAR
ncbi:hypothetical protein [Rugamonas sp. DEMB1]|uniref:hypothetical protein n=1 Tax=Rugamonas sp. DEMB1 TaxID=3039386 RepID=UPI0024482A3A|nr:hypothetical protein [Rugamonas sp. DEMB1]WGG49087.1 hypothetical protein QC826_21060 [Rugamonas sp. DEMB1]